MTVQCAAHAARALLAVLPAPASPHRRATCVSLTLRRPGRAVTAVRAAEPSSPPATAPAAQPTGASAGKAIVPDDEFSLAKVPRRSPKAISCFWICSLQVSFGVIGLGVGISLLSMLCYGGHVFFLLRYGFGSYFNLLPGSEWSALLLSYGFPLTIIGMALKARALYNYYAELKPVPCITYADALALREKCATPIQKQVRSDVTRFRYGDEQHLDEALQRIFQYGLVIFPILLICLISFKYQGGGIPRRNAPILQKIREEVTEDGKYSLVLVFEAKALELSDFEKRQVRLISTGSNH
ncbi:hypothetical protein HU200_033115 [Digitaria exilis]|uniref:Uncharacterized protein n=1 Tax=Digitaria exilis TaxID=1010633 RepID=A0A835BLN6_9POAL|nr:hypothetical protein HU200_033115 [Digitaria exilis]